MDLRSCLVLLGWLTGWWLLWRVPWLRLPGDVGAGDGTARSGAAPGSVANRSIARADVSVVIPARNEALSIATLLTSLRHQSVAPHQVLVVDDGSEDETAAIARRFPGVTVVTGEPVPPGWTGKAWACHQGAQLAAGDTLVFLDADVTLHDDGLAALLAEHDTVPGLLSVQPYHRMRRAYERLSAMFNIIGFMGVGAASPGRNGASRGAFGPCLVTGRDDYDRVGGHVGVRGEIVEDLALAQAYRRQGIHVRSLGGGEQISFRMYPGGLGQLIEGWSKNIATGASTLSPGRLFLIGFWVTSALISVQLVIEQAVGHPDAGRLQIAVVYVLFALQIATMLRQLGNFGWLTAVLYPGPLGIFVIVFARSTYLTLVRRRVMWRGRAVPISKARRWSRTPAATDD